MGNRFELIYRESDFKEIFYGDSLIKLYFTKSRINIIILTFITIACLFFIFKSEPEDYSIISLIFFLFILLAVLLFKTLNEIYEFFKWKINVDDYIRKGNRYKNSTITISEDVICFESTNYIDKTILSFKELISIDIFENRIVLNEGKINTFFLPRKSFSSDIKFEEFKTLVCKENKPM